MKMLREHLLYQLTNSRIAKVANYPRTLYFFFQTKMSVLTQVGVFMVFVKTIVEDISVCVTLALWSRKT